MINDALNLLPPEIQAQRRSERRYRDINRLVRIPLIGVLCIGLLTQGILFLMQQHLHSLEIDERHAHEQASATPSADVTKLTTQVNGQIATLRKTLGTGRTFRQPIVDILNSLPKGVTVTKLTIDQAGAVRLEGITDTRGTFLNLQDVMKTSKVLKNATTSSSASKREDVPFIYTARLSTL